MTREKVLEQIAIKKQEFIDSGQVPYALILGTEEHEALGGNYSEIECERLVYDPLIGLATFMGGGTIQWWDEKTHEDAEEAWLDMVGD